MGGHRRDESDPHGRLPRHVRQPVVAQAPKTRGSAGSVVIVAIIIIPLRRVALDVTPVVGGATAAGWRTVVMSQCSEGARMREQPEFDIAEAWGAIAEAEKHLQSGVPSRAELVGAVAELRADITNGEPCQEALQALRVLLARASRE
jgi:hypothetical protein